MATPVDAIYLDPILPPSHPSPSPCHPTHFSHQAVDSIHNVLPNSVVPELAISDSGHSTSAESVTIPLVAQNPINDPLTSIPSLRRSSRPSKAPTYLKDYKCSTITSNELTQSTHLSNNKSGSIHPSGINILSLITLILPNYLLPMPFFVPLLPPSLNQDSIMRLLRILSGKMP